MRFCSVFLFILCNFRLIAQLSGQYRIGQNQSAPFNTITSAVEHLNTVGISGNVTYLLEDEHYYEENILIQNFTRASPTDSFVLMPAPGIFCTIEGSGSANYVIGLSEVKNVVIAGNKQACGEPRLKILATENVRDVLNLTAVNDLFIKVTENVAVQACHIERASAVLPNLGAHTIVVSNINCDFDNIRIVHNRFSGNGGVSIYGFPFYPLPKDVYIQDNRFENCGSIDVVQCGKTVFEGNYLKNLHAWGDGAYYRAVNFQDIEELLFSSNKISGVVTSDNSLHLDLIQLRAIRSGLFSNNTIEGINYFGYNEIAPGSGVFVGNETRLVYLYGCKDIKMYNNTFNIYPKAGLGLNYDYASITAVSNYSRNYDIQLKNNIFRIAQGNVSSGDYETYGAILSGYSIEDIEDVVLDNNVYYVSGQANNVFSMVRGAAFVPQQVYSYQEHNAAFPGNNLNSYWEMPSFVSDTDLHLPADCNRGQVLSEVPIDIEGHLRHQSHPDIGAYEYFNGEYLLSNGNDTICSGSTVSYWTAYKQPGWFYEWGIYGNAGTVTEGAGTDSICVEWDNEPGLDSLWVYSYNEASCKSDTSVFKVVKSEKSTIRFPKQLLCYGEVLSVELTGTAPWRINYEYNNQEIELEGIDEVEYELNSEPGFYKLLYVSDKFCKDVPVNIDNSAEIQNALKTLKISPK